MPYRFKQDVAKEYFPFVSGRTAQRYLMRELRRQPELMARLVAAGFCTDRQRFSPREQELIREALGAP